MTHQNTYIVPLFAVCPIEYGSFDGCTDVDEGQIKAFLKVVYTQYPGAVFQFSDASFFAYKNDISPLGAMCVELEIYN